MTVDEFEQVREFLENLPEIEDLESSELFSKIIEDNKETLDMLRYLTPFYVEVVIQSLFSHEDFEEAEDFVCERIFDVDDRDSDERLWGWCLDRFEELYMRCARKNKGSLIRSLNGYFEATKKQNTDLTFQNLPNGSFPKTEIRSYLENLYESFPQDGEEFRLSIYISEYKNIEVEFTRGYIGWLLFYLKQEFIDTLIIPYGISVDTRPRLALSLNEAGRNYFYVRYFYTLPIFDFKLTPSLGGIFKKCLGGAGYTVPFWMAYEPTAILFYDQTYHMTTFDDGREYIERRPSTFKTKSLDYHLAPFATHARRDLLSGIRSEHEKAFIFSWDEKQFCSALAEDYGTDFIQVLASASLRGIKAFDADHQCMTLLSAVQFTFPYRAELNEPEGGMWMVWAGFNRTISAPLVVEKTKTLGGAQLMCNTAKKVIALIRKGEYSPQDFEVTYYDPKYARRVLFAGG